MTIVPTLILPRDDELEILGRTVERTLGRSVESIDVIGRGKAVVFSILCFSFAMGSLMLFFVVVW
jgi:hypothetical protein